LDLLGLVRPNRDFSIAYGGKNRKNVPPFRLAAARLASRGHDPARRKDITGISDFCKQLLGPDVSDLNFVFRG
jgi:hypothetical protein